MQINNLGLDIIYKIIDILCDNDIILPFELLFVSKNMRQILINYIYDMFNNPLWAHSFGVKNLNNDYEYIILNNYKSNIFDILNVLYKLSNIKKGCLIPNYIINSKEFNNVKNYSYHITERLIEIDGINISYMGYILCNNAKLGLMAIENNIYAYLHLGDIKYTNIDIIKYIALNRPDLVINNNAFKCNVSFIKYTLENNGLYLKYFDNSIKDSTKFVRIAVKNNINAFRYASARLKNNNTFKYNLRQLVPEVEYLEYY